MNPLLIISLTITSFIMGLCYNENKTLEDRLRLTLSIILILIFTRLIYYLIPYFDIKNLPWKSQIPYILISLIALLSLASIVICFCAWKKGGFKNLNYFNNTPNTGIITEFSYSIIAATICGIPGGILIKFSKFPFPVIDGFTGGFIIVLIFWFIFGLSRGLAGEFFSDEPQ